MVSSFRESADEIMLKKIDPLGAFATIIVYIGFLIVPDYPLVGIPILLISNLMWVYRGFIKKDWWLLIWQAGFVFINIRWFWLSL